MHSSQLETLIKAHTHLRSDQIKRARDIIERLRKSKTTKYNLKGNHIDLPFATPIHLVIGQVEDDASIKLGTDQVKTNLDLLKHVRAGHPDDFILYKPHPDVEAGLRMGKIATDMALQYADIIAGNADILNLFDHVNTIHTMTSNTGFEALIRGKKVVTYGAPFYAGWGLTTDLGQIPSRRNAKASLETLVYATLIAYPRYFHPKQRRACPVETTITRLEQQDLSKTGVAIRILSKLQGLLATPNPFWRR